MGSSLLILFLLAVVVFPGTPLFFFFGKVWLTFFLLYAYIFRERAWTKAIEKGQWLEEDNERELGF